MKINYSFLEKKIKINFKDKDFIIDLSGSIENNEGKKDLNKIDKLLNLFFKNET